MSAVIGLKVDDYYPQKKSWWFRLREKNSKVNAMPCHHKLEAYLDANIEAADIGDDRKGPLFRAAVGKTKTLSHRPLSRVHVWYMIRLRAADIESETAIGLSYVPRHRYYGLCHQWGERIEVAQRMGGHA